MTDSFVVISGVQENGDKFRPSDWNERLSSTLASLHPDNRLRYSPSVQPCLIEGVPSLVVARGLETSDPDAYRYIMDFAHTNQLRVQLDRRTGERALPLEA
jgi:hypothetical protein